MRCGKFLVILAVSVFLIGTLATTNVFAEGWKQSVVDLETNDAAQDDQLADHETRISDLEQQPPVAGIKACDANNQCLGIVLGHISTNTELIEIFLPSHNKMALIETATGNLFERSSIYYESSDCKGQGYQNDPRDIVFRAQQISGEYRYFVLDSVPVPIVFGYYIYKDPHDPNAIPECRPGSGDTIQSYRAIDVGFPFSEQVAPPLQYKLE